MQEKSLLGVGSCVYSHSHSDSYKHNLPYFVPGTIIDLTETVPGPHIKLLSYKPITHNSLPAMIGKN